MKTLILTIALTLVVQLQLSAQHFTTRAYTEITNVSMKQGLQFGRTLENRFTFGAFAQVEMQNIGTTLEFKERKTRELSFVGAYMAFPCSPEGKKLSVDFEVRTGVKNGKYFSILPAVVANYDITNRIEFVGGLSVRNFRPTLMSGIAFKM